jgi:phosphonate dehydrogenase
MSFRFKTVLVTSHVFDETLDYLKSSGVACMTPNQGFPHRALLHNELIQLSKTHAVDAIFGFMPDKIDSDLLDEVPSLKIVGCALKGTDNYDIAACKAHNVALTRCPDLLTNPTAELTIALMLGVARHVRDGDALVRGEGCVRGTGRLADTDSDGQASETLRHFPGWRGVYYGMGIEGAVVGLVGMGNIGRAIAQRLVGFDPEAILFHDPAEQHVQTNTSTGANDLLDYRCDWSSSSGSGSGLNSVYQHVPLPDLLKRSDFIITGCPLTPHTVELINADSLAQVRRGWPCSNVPNTFLTTLCVALLACCMLLCCLLCALRHIASQVQPHAILVNPSRGSVVDEAAVACSLSEGRLAGYAADVFAFEDWTREDRYRCR